MYNSTCLLNHFDIIKFFLNSKNVQNQSVSTSFFNSSSTTIRFLNQNDNYFVNFVYIYLLLISFWLLFHKTRGKYSFWTILCEIFVTTSTLLFTFPLIVLIHLIVNSYRGLIWVYLKCKYGSQIKLMSGSDSFWSVESFGNSSSFTTLFILEGICDLNKIRSRFENNLIHNEGQINGHLIYARMQRKVGQKCGFNCWVEDKKQFKIENHVKYLSTGNTTTSKKGYTYNCEYTEDELFEKMSTFLDQPLSHEDKPPWEVLIVPKFRYSYENDAKATNISRYAIIFRIGHAICDGISAGFILRNALADEKVRFSVNPFPKVEKSYLKTFIGFLILLFISPRIFFRALFLIESNVFHKTIKSKKLHGPKIIGWSSPFNLKDLNQVKKLMKCSTISIFTSVLGQSLINYGQLKELEMPEEIHIATTMAFLPYPNMKPQNRFTLTLVPLQIKSNKGIASIIQSVQKTLSRFSITSDIFLNYTMQNLVGRFPLKLLKNFSSSLHATAIISNVPGPADELTIFNGDVLIEPIAWVPLKGRTGIGVSFFSYQGRVRAAFIVDHTITSIQNSQDLKILINQFEIELNKLIKL